MGDKFCSTNGDVMLYCTIPDDFTSFNKTRLEKKERDRTYTRGLHMSSLSVPQPLRALALGVGEHRATFPQCLLKMTDLCFSAIFKLH